MWPTYYSIYQLSETGLNAEGFIYNKDKNCICITCCETAAKIFRILIMSNFNFYMICNYYAGREPFCNIRKNNLNNS